MLIQAFMILLFPDISKRKGVSEVVKSVAMRGGQINLRTTIFHFLAPVICIGSGGTLGPEGPAAQLGGGVSSKIGSIFSLSDERRRVFTAAGAGAAIAAIFNTPLGGVFFALEMVLLNDFHAPTFSALIIASVTASAISRVFLGNESVFIFEAVHIGSYSLLYVYAILGLLAGIISILFIKYSDLINHFFNKKLYLTKVPQWFVMILVGLLVGAIGFFYKEIFGIGYTAINEILAQSLSFQVVLTLLVIKFLLVPIVLYSGGFGGLFAPSLFIGACFGYIFSVLVNQIWGLQLDPVAIILVSMGAMLGGIHTIPISAILIIFEMTQDYTFILPLMLAVIISTMFVQITLKGSVQKKHLEAEGYKLFESRDLSLLRLKKVKDSKLEEIDLIPENTPLPDLISKLMKSPNNSFYTVNDDGKISGIIRESELRPIITEYESLKDVIVARDITNPKITIITSDDSLDFALNLFVKYDVDQIPVLADKDSHRILGVLTRNEIQNIYSKETLKQNFADGLAKELKTIERVKGTELVKGFSLIEYPLPDQFLGKTLSELKIRNEFGLEVLLIKKSKHGFSEYGDELEIVAVNPNYKLKNGDLLVLFGSEENIARFKEVIK